MGVAFWLRGRHWCKAGEGRYGSNPLEAILGTCFWKRRQERLREGREDVCARLYALLGDAGAGVLSYPTSEVHLDVDVGLRDTEGYGDKSRRVSREQLFNAAGTAPPGVGGWVAFDRRRGCVVQEGEEFEKRRGKKEGGTEGRVNAAGGEIRASG